jgi:peptide/nickel transport system substrate-binding protein
LGDQYGSRELVGTGPFKLVEWVSGSRAVLERNPDYAWATKAYAHTGPTRLERLIYAQIPEAATRAAALEKGDVSTAQITPPDLAALRGKPGIRIVLLPQPGTSRMILFNTAKGPTADIRVRRAINHAINKSILIRLPAWSGTGSPAFAALGRNLVPKESLPEYDRLKEEDYAYDVERAKQLLDEAGWKPGPDGVRVKDGQRLVIDNVVFEGFVGEMQAFQAMLRQVGIDFRIRGGDGSFLIATNTRGDFNTTLVGDSGYDAAGQLSEFFRSGAIYNWLGFRSSELDRLIDAASATSDIGERWKNLIAAMRIINRNALGVMAWEASYVFAVRESVQNLAFHEIGFPYFYPAWIRPER